ncbi:hypothetical protein F5148DRAFT_1150867 [Russula earlei]|uniref:Uncharacterized protein n=1 Tax=Russula earlei TaxID=71964 RepID=A0ACC0U401_9AGAM|nr:hypothetical protein F5148DRAFT_1150867 [Russula earlei]
MDGGAEGGREEPSPLGRGRRTHERASGDLGGEGDDDAESECKGDTESEKGKGFRLNADARLQTSGRLVLRTEVQRRAGVRKLKGNSGTGYNPSMGRKGTFKEKERNSAPSQGRGGGKVEARTMIVTLRREGGRRSQYWAKEGTDLDSQTKRNVIATGEEVMVIRCHGAIGSVRAMVEVMVRVRVMSESEAKEDCPHSGDYAMNIPISPKYVLASCSFITS